MNHIRSIPRSDFKIGMTSDRNVEVYFYMKVLNCEFVAIIF